MTHQWHDTFAHETTPAHHLDPRSKLAAALFFVGMVLFTPDLLSVKAIAYAVTLMSAFFLTHLSLKHVAARLLRIAPFVALALFSAALSGMPFHQVGQASVKALLSIGAMTLLSMTTPFPDLLRALEECRLPKVLVLFLAFLYRYGAVLQKETTQIERGWKARYFGQRWLTQWSRLGHVLAALLVRSYERAERIYAAMLARGFAIETATVRVLHFTSGDGVFVASLIVLLSAIRWGIRG